MRYLVVLALGGTLIGCNSGTKTANMVGNAATPTNASAVNSNTTSNEAAASNTAAPDYGTAQQPAEGYRAAFTQRWTRTGAPVTPAEVAAMLERQQPPEVVTALYGTGENSRWDTVASGIAKGDPTWLALAPRLADGTDAGTSDDFAMAAQDALTTNPTGALRMLAQTQMGAGACSENGFEVPAAQERSFYQTAVASVETVTDPALQQIKAQCLTALRSGMAGGAAPAAR